MMLPRSPNTVRLHRRCVPALLAVCLAVPAAHAATSGTDSQASGGNAASSADQGAARRNRIFHHLLHKKFPLTPAQIKKLNEATRQAQKAAQSQPVPKSGSRTVTVKVGPGGHPPVVDVSPNYGGALTVLDATGQPWPVTSSTVGNSKDFKVKKPVKKGKGASILTLLPTQAYAKTNLILTLKGLSTPVIVRLDATDTKNAGRTDLVVQAEGPNAVAPVSHSQLASTDNPIMRTLLDDVPPKGATRVPLKGGQGDAKAWVIKGHFYVRTALHIFSPAYIAVSYGAGGVGVYEMPMVPSMTATDHNGATVTLKVARMALLDHVLTKDGATVADAHYGPKPVSSGAGSQSHHHSQHQ